MALAIVAVIHAIVGYALVTGLAYNVVKKVAEDLNTFDVKEEPPPPEEEPPPPPPDQPVEPPPVVSPPPIVQTNTPPPVVIRTVATPPPVYVPTPIAPPAPPPAAPAAPAAPTISKAASARGNPGSWVTDADYPAAAQRREEQGRVGVTFEVNAAGRIENCRVSSTSGSSILDDTTCKLVTRRGRYTPALNAVGQAIPGGTKSLNFRWVLPE